jgi:hypothetical protein
MNCKPGDVAIIVRGAKRDLGRMVLVVGPARRPDSDWTIRCVAGRPLIAKDHNGQRRPAVEPCAMDYQLRPLRDNDGEDETFTWAGRPLEKAADDVAELHRQVDRLADIARQLAAIQKLL